MMGNDGVAPRSLLPDRDIWACAQKVMSQYGDRVIFHIAERVGVLSLVGDMSSVDMWMRIADRVDQLSDNGTSGRRTRH
ncbi:DUF6961 family protein [Sphingomonas arantia]|uniref:DUF6961 family protein n=1 Tax=Sphingomonas arantia TaxID=1460676 RepID=A0ABW4TWC1_9SPHN